jgi:ABC-type uncharacterized transport system permease subunit
VSEQLLFAGIVSEFRADALMAGVALHLLIAAMSEDSMRLSVVVRLNLH